MKKLAKCERCPNTFELQRFCSHACAHKLNHLSEEQKQDLIKTRLQDSIVIDDNGCWIWQKGKSPSGYGKIHYRGRHLRAHRLSYEIYKDKFEPSMVVMHLCDIPACINPDHLRLGTTKDNVRDSIDKNRWPMGEEKHNSILNAEQVLEIKNLLQAGIKQPEIAKQFNITPSIISDINCGKSYSSITKITERIQKKGRRENAAKLTEEQAILIKKALKAGQSHSSLARQYGVSRPTISLIHSGKNWTHITID